MWGNLDEYYFPTVGDYAPLTEDEERSLINGIDCYTRPLRVFESVFNRKRPVLTIEDKKYLIEVMPIEDLAIFLEQKYKKGDFWRERLGQLTDSLSAMKEHYRKALPMIERLIKPNLRLVVSIAKRYVRKGVDIDDLVEYGNMGLWRAVEKFDSERMERFCTYAVYAIRSAVIKGVTRGELFQQKVTYLSELDLERLTAKSDIIPELHEDELNNLVDGILTNEREKAIIKMRFGLGSYEDMTLQDIGKEFKITKERVRQIEARALERLRENTKINTIYKHYVESLD